MDHKFLEIVDDISIRQPISMTFSSTVKSKPVIIGFSFDYLTAMLNVSFATDIPSYLISNLRYEFWIEPIYQYLDMMPTSEPIAGFLWCRLDNAHFTIDKKGLVSVEAKLPRNLLLSQHKFYLMVLAPTIDIKLTTYIHNLMLRNKNKLDLKQRLLPCWRRKYNYVECACSTDEKYLRRVQSESLLLSRRLFLDEMEKKDTSTPIIVTEKNCIYILNQSVVEDLSLKESKIKLSHVVSLFDDENNQPLVLNDIGLSNQIAFSYDDQFIAVAGQNGKIYLIDLLMLTVAHTIHLDIKQGHQISGLVLAEHWLYVAQKGQQAPLIRININEYCSNDVLRIQIIPLPVSKYGYDSLEINCCYLVIASASADKIEKDFKILIYAINLESIDYQSGNLEQGFHYISVDNNASEKNIQRVTKTCNYKKFIITHRLASSFSVINLNINEDDDLISLFIDKTTNVRNEDSTILANKYSVDYQNFIVFKNFDFGVIGVYALLSGFQHGGAVLTIISDVFDNPTTLGVTLPIDGLLIKHLTTAKDSNCNVMLYAMAMDINNRQHCILVWSVEELIRAMISPEATMTQRHPSYLQPQKIEFIHNNAFGELYAIWAKPSVIRLINEGDEDPFSNSVVFGGKGGEKAPDYQTRVYGLVDFRDTSEERGVVIMDGYE